MNSPDASQLCKMISPKGLPHLEQLISSEERGNVQTMARICGPNIITVATVHLPFNYYDLEKCGNELSL